MPGRAGAGAFTGGEGTDEGTGAGGTDGWSAGSGPTGGGSPDTEHLQHAEHGADGTGHCEHAEVGQHQPGVAQDALRAFSPARRARKYPAKPSPAKNTTANGPATQASKAIVAKTHSRSGS